MDHEDITSPLYTYFCEMADAIEPRLQFQDDDVRSWQQQVYAVVRQAMGRLPNPVPLETQTLSIEEKNGVIYERVQIYSEAATTVPFVLLRRSDLPSQHPHPALICLHGHGPYGKESLIGNAPTTAEQAVIAQYNYDYALQFAKHGFITVSPDLRNFGERGVPGEYPGKDSCNMHFLRGLLFGVNLLALNVWDVGRLVDYLVERTDVCSDRIGCVGFSLGGTTALLAAAVEPRIAAAGIFSALSTYKEYAIRHGHFCGSQMLPGILPDADWPEVAGLIAPRPLYISHRNADSVFPIGVAQAAYESLQRVYDQFNATSRLAMHTEVGGHMFAMGFAPEFFLEHL